MTIYKYHFAVNTSVGFDNGEAFNTGCSGDGVSEMPMHEIEQVLENHVFLLQGKFPEGAINVGINLGICASDIGEPEEVPDENICYHGKRPGKGKTATAAPMPAGTYECIMTEASQNADGTVSLGFRVTDLDAKAADLVRSHMGERFPFHLGAAMGHSDGEVHTIRPFTLSEPFPSGVHYPIYSKDAPDLTPGEDQREGGLAAHLAARDASPEFNDLMRRTRNAKEAMAQLEPEKAIHVDINQAEKVAGMISTMLGITYQHALIVVLEMVKNEHRGR